MSKRIAIISGATKGLGRALALDAAERDYHVIGIFRSDTSSAALLDKKFADNGWSGQFICHDLTTSAPSLDLRDDAEILVVNNAISSFQPKPIHLLCQQELLDLFNSAVIGAFHLSQAVIRRMVKAKSGTIINVLSGVVSERPPKGFAAYAAAKFGLLGLTRAMAIEYEQHAIRVISVSPPFMNTPLTQSWGEHWQSIMQREGARSPAEIAKKILELADGASTAESGHHYELDQSPFDSLFKPLN
ncbi:MAG TPA: SDR family oxidoreductase [Planktothrix sp.]|jgi:3-oxoacyl-[acyl-carrier protein] reductase